MVNLATGNLQLVHPVCGWGGKGGGISFVLTFNSQSARSSSVGPKWTHSYNWQVLSQGNQAIVLAGDGTETVFALTGGQYLPPAGVYDQLVRNADSTWTLTHKGGLKRYFLADGRLDRIVDLNGNTVQCAYSGGNLVSVTDASGRVLQLGYSGSRLTSVTDAEGRVWTLSYDGSGRLVSVTDPLLNGVSYSTQFGYGANDNVVRLTNRLGKTWSYGYSIQNCFASMTDPDGRVWSLSYGFGGGIQRFGQQSQQMDDMPIPMPPIVCEGGVYDPSGASVYYGMTSRGELGVVRDGLGNQTVFLYDAQHNRTTIGLPSGAVWQYTYDARGNPLSVTDPLGNTTRYTYQCCRVVQRTDALGRVTTYSYDAWGRLVGIDYPQSADVSLQYDAEGRLTQAVDGTGTRTFEYDSWGRRVRQTAPAGTSSATYDAAGRLTSQTDVTGRQITYQYDGAGRLVRVSDPTSWVQYAYNANSAVVRETYSNNTRVEYVYDGAGRVTSVQHRVNSTGALIIGYAVTYDAAGRVTRINESPSKAVTTYRYDGAGRLLREERTVNRPYLGEYQYDASGNRTFARRVENGVETHRGTYTYDGAGRLIQVVDAATNTTETYVWNADGTLASFPGPGYTRLLEYDEEGRLVRIRRDYGGGNVQLAYEYGYGFDGGRRWRKDYLNGVWTRYPCGVACVAGELVEQTSDLSGSQWTTSALYLQGISLVRRNNEWHHFDPLGTAQVIANGSAQVVSNNVYDLFGVLRYQQGGAQTPWRWKDKESADEGLLRRKTIGYLLPAAGLPTRIVTAQLAYSDDFLKCLYNCFNRRWREEGLPPIVDLACLVASVCCFLAPNPFCCTPATACLGAYAGKAFGIITWCAAYCAGLPVSIKPVIQNPIACYQ